MVAKSQEDFKVAYHPIKVSDENTAEEDSANKQNRDNTVIVVNIEEEEPKSYAGE